MNIKTFIAKHLKKTIHKREFWFSVLLYPTISIGYLYLKNSKRLFEFVSKIGIWYFVIAFIILIYITFYVAFEVIEKKLLFKVQGDKLKIKQEQKWR
jgi:hypothetical protein